ncbi:uncharacterized protein [Diadema antillarum]|uniref:uncharacterized protein n=1 Tax=Diadema antillarum TaxID=105358 RepID=UPI003A856417
MTSFSSSKSVRAGALPPVSSLDESRHTSPIMLLSGSNKRGSASENCLALMWPSASDDGARRSLSPVFPSIHGNLDETVHRTQETLRHPLNNAHEEGSVTYNRTMDVMVCPSGQTVVRMRTSVDVVLSTPSIGPWSPSASQHPALPYSPHSSPYSPKSPSMVGSRQMGTSPDSTMWLHSGSGRSSSPSFPGRKVQFNPDHDQSSGSLPSPGQSPSMIHSGSGDSPRTLLSSSIKKKGPRRRKISGKDKGDRVRFSGGAQEILEEDHPEEDVASGSRCPCVRLFLLVCMAAVLLAVLFYLCLWLVAQHRASPAVVVGGETLETVLHSQLYGQPIVVNVLPKLLSRFLAKDAKDQSTVIMFHGQPGVGKTFVVDMMGKTLFPKSAGEQCMLKFLPSLLEIRDHLVTAYDYSVALEDFIDQGRVLYRSCPVVLYVVEDLGYDSAANLFEALAFTLKSVRKRQASQEQKMAFVLITNIGGNAIVNYVMEQFHKDRKREDIGLQELTPILESGHSVFPKSAPKDLPTGVEEDTTKLESVYTQLLAVVDSHIPFLPLERQHVLLCIQQAAAQKNVTLAREDMEWIADKLSYYPENGQFSSSGCKKVEEKANLLSEFVQTRNI